MAKKTFFKNSEAFKSLEQNNEKLNLIDGADEFDQEYSLDFKIDAPIERKAEVNTNIVIPIPKKIKPKRTNIPIFQDEYVELQCISLVADLTVTALVEEGVKYIIKKYNNVYGEEIQNMKALRLKKLNK